MKRAVGAEKQQDDALIYLSLTLRSMSGYGKRNKLWSDSERKTGYGGRTGFS
jgi:hypothetical protein